MTFTYNNAIPAAANNPSNDQPDMLTNTQSINSIIAVDHASFNTANGGTHTQMHLPNFTNPTTINGAANQGSVVYSAAGVADATRAQIYYKNAFGLQIPLSPIKAFGSFDNAGNLLNGFNLTVTAHGAGSGVYTLDIPLNILTTANYLVLISTGINALNPGRGGVYVIVSATQFQVAFRNFINGVLADPDQFSITVLQI